MFIDINKIGPEGVTFDRALTLSSLEGQSAERIAVDDVVMSGEATRGSRGVNLEARLTARVRLTCSRCLETFDRETRHEFFLILVPDAVELAAGEEEVRDEDVALFYTRDGRASLEDIATEQIYLGLPLKPICRGDCRGLCPVCGTNRNREACGCRSESPDPRLAPLLELKKTSRDA